MNKNVLLVVLLALPISRARASQGFRLDGTIGEGGGLSWPLTSDAATPASSGKIRLGNNELICWRDNGDTADQCIRIDTNDAFKIDGNVYPSGHVTLDNLQRLELNGAGSTTYITGTSGSIQWLVKGGSAFLHTGNALWTYADSFITTRYNNSPGAITYTNRRPDATPNDGDVLTDYYAQGYDDAPTANQNYIRIVETQEDVSAGAIAAAWDLQVASSNALTSYIKADGKAAKIVLGAPHEYVGEMYQRDNATATTVSVAGTWYEVDNFSDGDLYGWSHSTGDLTVTNAGSYVCWFGVSFNTSGTNQDTEAALSVNDAIQDKCISYRTLGTGSSYGVVSTQCSLTLAASDVVKLEVRNNTATNDITVKHANVLCSQR